MAKKKIEEIKLPPSKVEILAKEIYGHYLRIKETGLYGVVDRTKGFHFGEVVKDGFWSYGGNGKDFDSVIIVERLFTLEKCKVLKYPTYELSKETLALYEEFSAFSNKEISKEDLIGNAIDERGVKMQGYIDQINAMPPVLKEVDQLAYVDGYNGDLGFPIVPVTDIPNEVLESMSNKFAGYAFNYFSTIHFLYDDNFAMNTSPVIVDPDAVNDLVVTFTYKAPLNIGGGV